MGKGLIIKGADFSQNGLLEYEYLIGISDEQFNSASENTNPGTASRPYAFADKLSVFSTVISESKKIIGIRIRCAKNGIVPIYISTFTNDTTETSSEFVENLIITEDMVNNIVDIFLTTPIILQSNQKIVFGNHNSLNMTGKWYYGTGNYDNLCIYTTHWVVSTAPLTVDYLII